MKKKTCVNSGAEQKAVTATAALKQLLEGPERKTLLRIAYKWCGNRIDAETLVQDACYQALKEREQYDGSRPFFAWLCAILRNVFVSSRRGKTDLLRNAAVLTETAEPDADEEAVNSYRLDQLYCDDEVPVLDRMVQAEEAAKAWRIFVRLPPRYRDVLRLCELQELSYEEAARRLRVGVSTLKGRLWRARALLRRTDRREWTLRRSER